MEVYEFLKELHDVCVKEVDKISFDKTQIRAVHLIGLYGSIIEFTGSFVCLVENKHRTGIPTIFRSLFETYVHFHNLHEEATYGYHMEVSNQEQWLKLLKEAKKGVNPYLSAMTKQPNLDELIEKCETELEDLADKGFRALNIYDRFKKAGMVNEYRSLYNSLSNDSHSSIRALIDRHIEIDKSDHRLVFYKDLQLDDLLLHIDFTAGILIDSSLKLHKVFKTSSVKTFENMAQKLNEIRDGYKK
jgi:hypothetical protein